MEDYLTKVHVTGKDNRNNSGERLSPFWVFTLLIFPLIFQKTNKQKNTCKGLMLHPKGQKQLVI